MNDLPNKPRNVWLRSFYGFGPEEDGYIGWTEEAHRDRMRTLVSDGDLFMIYGASTSETAKPQRNRVLGFLQVETRPIRDIDKSSDAGKLRKRTRGWSDKWTYAIPVIRAWRADEPILLERIAPHTYRPEAGQAIAVWSPPLLADEVELALKVKVTEVNVFGERPISQPVLENTQLKQAFEPSRAFPGSFGTRTITYADGPTYLYLARFEGNSWALLGQSKSLSDKTALIKIGVSNDLRRRLSELNAGFPPASIGKWSMQLRSELFEGRNAAEGAEQIFKDEAKKQLESLGGEFFRGDFVTAKGIFANIPGVSRFGR